MSPTSGSGYCASLAYKAPYVYCADPMYGYIWVYDVGNPAAPTSANPINSVHAHSISTQ